jgi:hypothetical protein
MEKEEDMNKTLAEILLEVEAAVRPLGFKIESIQRRENGRALIGPDDADNGELAVAIIRKGNVG